MAADDPFALLPPDVRQALERRRFITGQLEQLFATGALYQEVKYNGQYSHKDLTDKTVPAIYPVPSEMKLFCEHCDLETFWSPRNDKLLAGVTYHSVEYYCRNCRGNAVHYFLHWEEFKLPENNWGICTRIGQYPAMEVRLPANLKLEKEDKELYRRALKTRNAGYGLGALAYLRRVVENNLNQLIDMCAEVERKEGVPVDEEALQQAKRLTFAEKADFAQHHLPERFKRGGHNPFGILSDFLSEGIHADPEDVCVERFDRVRALFEQFFSDLRYEINDAGKLSKMMGDFTRKRGKIGST